MPKPRRWDKMTPEQQQKWLELEAMKKPSQSLTFEQMRKADEALEKKEEEARKREQEHRKKKMSEEEKLREDIRRNRYKYFD